jgi:hypothetical protein
VEEAEELSVYQRQRSRQHRGGRAVGEEEHAAAGGLPILPRMVDGKQRPSATRAYLEVGKGKVQSFSLISSIFLCCSYSRTNWLYSMSMSS